MGGRETLREGLWVPIGVKPLERCQYTLDTLNDHYKRNCRLNFKEYRWGLHGLRCVKQTLNCLKTQTVRGGLSRLFRSFCRPPPRVKHMEGTFCGSVESYKKSGDKGIDSDKGMGRRYVVHINVLTSTKGILP